MTNPRIVKTTVIRHNIKIEMNKQPKDCKGTESVYEAVTSDIFEELRSKLINFPKTIILAA